MSTQAETRTGTVQAQKKVADQLRSTIEQGRRTVEESRHLHKETETVLQQSRLALLHSRHLIAQINRRTAGRGGGQHNGWRIAQRRNGESTRARVLHSLVYNVLGITA
jgi:hypothetical protein